MENSKKIAILGVQIRGGCLLEHEHLLEILRKCSNF